MVLECYKDELSKMSNYSSIIRIILLLEWTPCIFHSFLSSWPHNVWLKLLLTWEFDLCIHMQRPWLVHDNACNSNGNRGHWGQSMRVKFIKCISYDGCDRTQTSSKKLTLGSAGQEPNDDEQHNPIHFKFVSLTKSVFIETWKWMYFTSVNNVRLYLLTVIAFVQEINWMTLTSSFNCR